MTNKLAVAIFSLLVLLSSCIKDDDDVPDSIINYVEEGDKVPDFSVDNGKGDTFSSVSFQNKRSLLVLFVTSCGDCKRELPKAQEVWELLEDDDEYQVVAVARKEEFNSVDTYWKDEKYTMPFYLDPDRSIFDLFANSTVPRFYVINTEGVITWMGVEKIELSAEEIVGKMRE